MHTLARCLRREITHYTGSQTQKCSLFDDNVVVIVNVVDDYAYSEWVLFDDNVVVVVNVIDD